MELMSDFSWKIKVWELDFHYDRGLFNQKDTSQKCALLVKSTAKPHLLQKWLFPEPPQAQTLKFHFAIYRVCVFISCYLYNLPKNSKISTIFQPVASTDCFRWFSWFWVKRKWNALCSLLPYAYCVVREFPQAAGCCTISSQWSNIFKCENIIIHKF